MRNEIHPDKFHANSHDIWANRWMLLLCGDYTQMEYNTMTVAWGSLGTMWNKPFVQVVVRPSRYTYEFMEKYDSFTLNVFPDKYRDTLLMLGSKSGRDIDKIAESKLSPESSIKIHAPCFNEAELVLEAKKMYWQDMVPEHFINRDIMKQYPQNDFHRIYFGELVHISGIDMYRNEF